jgi:hypothetical protein
LLFLVQFLIQKKVNLYLKWKNLIENKLTLLRKKQINNGDKLKTNAVIQVTLKTELNKIKIKLIFKKMSYLNEIAAWKLSILILLVILTSTFIGNIIGKLKKPKEEHLTESSSDFSSFFGLLFLILAFTFGMSINRYDTRRQIIIQESNTISTALLRADLYAEKERLMFRNDFKQYLEARINYFKVGIDTKKREQLNILTRSMSNKLWDRASRLSHNYSNTDATLQMIPALNEMFDITTTRAAAENAKIPDSIIWLLFILTFITSFFSGYSSASKDSVDWFANLGFGIMISLTLLFILDLDRPYRGFVTLDESNKSIIELRNYFN